MISIKIWDLKKKERQYTSVWMDVDCDNYIEFR